MEVRLDILLLTVLIGILIYVMLQQQRQPPVSCPVCPKARTVVVRKPVNNKPTLRRNTNTPLDHPKVSSKDDPHHPRIPNNPRINVDIKDTTFVNHDGVGGDPIRDFDYRAYHDKLTPPRHRNLHESEVLDPALIPIYSRGLPRPYRKVGMLTAVIDPSADPPTYKILNLIGSKISSGRYNYFAVPTKTDDNAKFELSTNKELFNDDEITLTTLNQKYTVQLDKNALPLYAGIV
jgi:hypothetical protein